MKIDMEQSHHGMVSGNLSVLQTLGASWTATQDCWALGVMSKGTASNQAFVSIYEGSTGVASVSTMSTVNVPVCFPVAKGQTVTTGSDTGHFYYITLKACK